LIDQIEFADVIVLNKMDLVTDDQALEVKAIVKALNPGAEILLATRGEVPLDSVMDTGLFDYEKAASSAGWIRELQLEGEHTPETEEYGISSFTFRAKRPFDAERFWALVNDEDFWAPVLRAKGFFWVGADDRIAYQLAQAGGVNGVTTAGFWWAAVPRDHWGQPDGERPDQMPTWDDRFGDRAQTLVFIGQHLDEAAIRARLESCFVEEAVLDAPDGWSGGPNPFPALKMAVPAADEN
ncbi:MAG: GTP-binding protein, partial [Planctomycetota bacterium]